MSTLSALIYVAICGSAYAATYHPAKAFGGSGVFSIGTESSWDHPAPNQTLTAIYHGPSNRAALTAPLATSDTTVQALITGEINRLRRIKPATNMMKMSWDPAIQAAAQKWADGCKFVHPAQGSADLKTTKYGLGQNIAYGTGSMTWNQTIKMWYDEVNYFTMGAAPKNGAVVGHYTALVWSSSYAVGCGYKLCPAGTITSAAAHFFVCDFGPAGNISPNLYKPYEAGTKCGKCPKACDDGLCTNPCPYTNVYSNCEVASGYPALFPNGCTGSQNEALKASCKATCICKAQGLLY